VCLFVYGWFRVKM